MRSNEGGEVMISSGEGIKADTHLTLEDWTSPEIIQALLAQKTGQKEGKIYFKIDKPTGDIVTTNKKREQAKPDEILNAVLQKVKNHPQPDYDKITTIKMVNKAYLGSRKISTKRGFFEKFFNIHFTQGSKARDALETFDHTSDLLVKNYNRKNELKGLGAELKLIKPPATQDIEKMGGDELLAHVNQQVQNFRQNSTPDNYKKAQESLKTLKDRLDKTYNEYRETIEKNLRSLGEIPKASLPVIDEQLKKDLYQPRRAIINSLEELTNELTLAKEKPTPAALDNLAKSLETMLLCIKIAIVKYQNLDPQELVKQKS